MSSVHIFRVEEPPVVKSKMPSIYEPAVQADCKNRNQVLSEKLAGRSNEQTHQSVVEEKKELNQKSKIE